MFMLRTVVVLIMMAALTVACGPQAVQQTFNLKLSTAPVQVSGPSPYGQCTLGVAGGERFVNGEVETWVAVNPQALKEGRVNLVGVWMADRWSNGAGSGVVSAASFDGGATWETHPLAFSGCAEGALDPSAGRAGDPWVAFGPDGRAYTTALIIDKPARTYAIGVATSGDGGRTWGDFTLLQQATRQDDAAAVDKESVTADPTRPGTAYVVWMRNLAPTREAISGPTMFAKTTDGGKTWTVPRTIFTAGPAEMSSGSIIVADARTGFLYHFFRWIEGVGNTQMKNSVGLQVSRDAGETWSQAERVIAVQSRPVMHPNFSGWVRTFGELPMPAIDPVTGRLYVAWEDARFSSQVDIALAYSDDEGKTWSAPVQVDAAKESAFRPTVAVNSRRQVGVSYYQFPSAKADGQRMPTEMVLTVLSPDLKDRKEHRVAGPFDLSYAPKAPGPFLGDYLGLTAVDDWFHMFYVTANQDPGNPTDVHAVSIRP
ncbi:MAG TPA: sialidase family protein [Symbiobacteriaceae bacterium]|nr:sialidase family protein [Symbiobacteriaceae bacterium]